MHVVVLSPITRAQKQLLLSKCGADAYFCTYTHYSEIKQVNSTKKYERLNAKNLSQLTQKPVDISEPIFTILTSF